MQKRNLWQEALYWVLLLALLTAGGFLLFTNLGETGISDCDEARHGINAYEMMQSGDYVVTTYRGEPDYWNLKPPLTDYCIMLGYRIFGYNALGLRFYSALSMMLTMIVLALWTRRRYGRIASLCTQLMLLGCGFIYGPHFARFGDADAQMLLFYVVAMICMLESHRRPRLLYGTALCFGLAFMSKSWHAALIPVTCLVYLVVTGEIRRLKPRHYLGLIFFGLLPIAPWAIARYQRDGMAFFEKMLSIDVVKRATTVHEDHRGGAGYYVSYLLSDRAVLVASVAVLIALCWKAVRRLRLSHDQWGVLLWFAVPLVLYSLCVSKLQWYIYVCLPPLAVGFGMALGKLARGGLRSGWKALPRLACLAAAVVLMVSLSLKNWENVSAAGNEDRYQRLIWEMFDREMDAGTRVYVQYESENNYYAVDYRSWVQDDELTAMLAGDLVCMDGGVEAFCQEEESAYLICHEIGMDWDILGEYPLIYQDGPIMLIENLM